MLGFANGMEGILFLREGKFSCGTCLVCLPASSACVICLRHLPCGGQVLLLFVIAFLPHDVSSSTFDVFFLSVQRYIQLVTNGQSNLKALPPIEMLSKPGHYVLMLTRFACFRHCSNPALPKIINERS